MIKILFAIQLLVIAVLFCISHTNTFAGDSLTVLAVGDIMMGSTYPHNILPPDDGKEFFLNVKDEFKENDVVFGNLEGPLIKEGRPAKCKGASSKTCYEFRIPTRYALYLKEVGFNVMSIANNHSLDFGLEGVESTINTLSSEGISATGGDVIAHLNIKGKRVAVVGFSYSSSPYSYSILDIERARETVRDLRSSNDIVIVSFHGGAEGGTAQYISDKEEFFLGEDRGNVIRFSRAVIDSGADMVIGHGPHLLRRLEVYKGKLIAYSLGNFLTYGRFNIRGLNGVSVILKAELNQEGNFIKGRLIPLKLLNGGIPHIDPEREAIKLLQELTKEHTSGISIEDNGMFYIK